VTDAGLAHLSGLPKLEILSLRDTRVTDAGLAHLQGLSGLWQLELSNTPVTDAGLLHLKTLFQLANTQSQGARGSPMRGSPNWSRRYRT